VTQATCYHPPGFIFDTAAIDKTLKEQEVSLAEAAAQATCGYTANEPNWSTLLKGMNKFPSCDCTVNSRLLTAAARHGQRDAFTSTTIILFIIDREQRELPKRTSRDGLMVNQSRI